MLGAIWQLQLTPTGSCYTAVQPLSRLAVKVLSLYVIFLRCIFQGEARLTVTGWTAKRFPRKQYNLTWRELLGA